MSKHELFQFQSLDELGRKIDNLGLNIKLNKDYRELGEKVEIPTGTNKKHTITSLNAVAVLPMEGCDSNPDGSPSELVERRYRRFVEGGAGLLW